MTIRQLANGKIEVEFDWTEVDGSLDKAVELALSYPEIQNLTPGSDYMQQYYDIQVSANTVVLIFRPEPS